MIELTKTIKKELIMKKIIAFFVMLAAVFAVSASVLADDITLKVNGRALTFREEPKPVILNDRTYVPLRRVLEYMGARVEWNDATRTVKVTSYDNVNVILLTIDNPEIEVYTFTSILHADKKTVTSDVAPIILNDRTMLPIRVIAENLGATVDYDESGIAEITTPQAKYLLKKTFGEEFLEQKLSPASALSESLPVLSLYSDAKKIKKGDTVSVNVKVSGIEKAVEGASFSGLVTTVLYNPENFEYEDFTCITSEGETSPALSAKNEAFYENAAKIVFILPVGSAHFPAKDGTVLRLDFKALTDDGGTFSLSDGISELGYDNELILSKDGVASSCSNYNELYIDTTPITVK